MPDAPPPPALLWDLDGTLIDQTAPILRCYNEIVASMGRPAPGEDTVRRSLGGPLRSTLALFLDAERLDEAEDRFRRRFPEIMFDGLEILPEALETLQAFAALGAAQAILTNKHGDAARAVSRHCGFDRFAPFCLGNLDTEWSKPDPEFTERALAAIGRERAAACVVGDSPTDVETALNAGLPAYGVATGAHSTEELRAAGAAAAFAGLGELRRAFLG